MTASNRLPGIDLGKGERGQQRLAALQEMARAAGHFHARKPSIGKLIKNLADQHIRSKTMYYAILSDNLSNPDSIEAITLQQKPGRTNLSGEIRETGWLGTTDDIHREALGVFDAYSARVMLQEHGIQIPDDVPVRHTQYSTGGSDHAEKYNRNFAYPYQGPWYNVPADEVRWCRDAQIITDVMAIRDTYDDTMYLIVVTADEKPTSGWATRSWYETTRIHSDDNTKPERWAKSLIGKTFDRSRLQFHT